MASEFPPRVRWCLLLAAPLAWPEPDELGGYPLVGVHRARGGDELRQAAIDELKVQHGIATRDQLIAWAKVRLHGGGGERGWELGTVVHVVGRAYWAELVSEDDALTIVLVAGKLAQGAHGSWVDYAASFQRGADLEIEPISDGRSHRHTTAARAIDRLLADGGAWRELPWDLPLDVTLVDPRPARPRAIAMTCSTCGAPRTASPRPPASAFAYCEMCGSLVGYDVTVAMTGDAARPGPAYEAVRAARAAALDAARARGDAAAYAAIQRELFGAWLDASPTAAPVRVKDPAYRARYVEQLARIETAAAFDDDAARLGRAVAERVQALAFVDVGGGTIRVAGDAFRALVDAGFALVARRDELCVAGDLYALHPDGASRELQRDIAIAMFVQAWLPYLDESEAQALLARAGIAVARAIAEVPPETRAIACSRCGGPLVLRVGATRVVCEHCGRLVDAIS